MTATQIISEIESLPPQQKEEVIRFVVRLDRQRLSGAELTDMAGQLVGAAATSGTEALKEELEQGFYGR